jgi:protein-S-isoprenylcysteine O-methyltransferase Ste14
VKRVLYPPHWVAILLTGEVLADRMLPVRDIVPSGARWAGIVVMGLGIGLTVWAASLFKRRGTGVRPFTPSTAVVEGGPYRFTRNPMYLGMTLLLLGVAVLLRSLMPFAAPIVFVLVIHVRFILPEEAHMERSMGAAYLAFKQRVRRWI